MTTTELHIAIARATGWKEVHAHGLAGLVVGIAPPEWADRHAPTCYEIRPYGIWHEVPHYPDDLDACHEMESWILPPHCADRRLFDDYRQLLIAECGEYYFFHADPPMRVKCFLKTIGKWEDEE